MSGSGMDLFLQALSLALTPTAIGAIGLGALVGSTANLVGISITARSAKKFFASAPFAA